MVVMNMKISERVREMMRDFLRIDPPSQTSITVRQEMDFQTNAFKNRLWYRGRAYELNQFYRQRDNFNYSFWGSVPTSGLEIRKVHSGLPKVIVDTLVNIVASDFNGFEFNEDEANEELWEQIADENNFPKLLKHAIKDGLCIGDGAFKISFDSDISKLPIVEWFPGDKVEIVYERGRVKEIIFFVDYKKKNKTYTLQEHYGRGLIYYKLFDGNKEIALNALAETENLQPVEFERYYGPIMLAVPFMISESEEWTGRGQSVFDGKVDNFDALDEIISQWWQAVREGRAKRYIPESLLPRDPNTGELVRPNAYDNQFIKKADVNTENGKNEISQFQPNIPTDDYLQSYMTALDLCLQGLISPSTLGIDVKKLDNAEAQREKEKATLYSRANIIEALEGTLPALVEIVLKSHYISNSQSTDVPEVTVAFGEYANPSFEAVVETLSNPNTPMSIEAKVEELWGDSKDDEWKATEVARIKEQTGVAVLDEPTFAGNLDLGVE